MSYPTRDRITAQLRHAIAYPSAATPGPVAADETTASGHNEHGSGSYEPDGHCMTCGQPRGWTVWNEGYSECCSDRICDETDCDCPVDGKGAS